jgi:hypothetical protein
VFRPSSCHAAGWGECALPRRIVAWLVPDDDKCTRLKPVWIAFTPAQMPALSCVPVARAVSWRRALSVNRPMAFLLDIFCTVPLRSEQAETAQRAGAGTDPRFWISFCNSHSTLDANARYEICSLTEWFVTDQSYHSLWCIVSTRCCECPSNGTWLPC